MNKHGQFVTALVLISFTLFLSGCIMHRTVSSGGQTISSGYVVKRPLKDAFQNSR